jgi:hypothetical protein
MQNSSPPYGPPVDGAELLLQGTGEGLHSVSRRMAWGVVEFFEVVQVDEEQREDSPTRPARSIS